MDNSWGSHLRATVLLGIPLVGAQLAQVAINTTDIVLVGWLGTTELASVVMATQLFFVTFIFGTGFTAAVVPMVAQALGQGDGRSVRRSVRMGLWIICGFFLVVSPVLWFSRPILIALGQDPEIAGNAQSYLRIAMWGILPALGLMTLRSFVTGLERGGIVLYITLGMFAINAALAYALIFGNFGAPALGIFGAAIALVCANLSGFLALGIYVCWHPATRDYSIFNRFWRLDPAMLRELFYLGLPISLTILAETSLFAAASLLMGMLGKQELAAHGIALQLASIAFMIPLGLAQVATVRVGLSNGRGDLEGVRKAAGAVLMLSVGLTAIGGVLYATMPLALGANFLDVSQPDSAKVLNLAVPLIMTAGAFQLVDGLQAVGAGLLRGLKDTRVPMYLALTAYWPIGFTCAWIFGFPLGMRGPGVWLGFVTGLGAAALFLCGRFWILLQRHKKMAR